MQVDWEASPARFAVSTVAEIDHLLPTLLEWRDKGRAVNVLYGVPVPPSQIGRLAGLARKIGPGSITLMMDHASHLPSLSQFHEAAGFPCGVFLKVDTGYHRAGLPPAALNKDGLLERLVEMDSQGSVQFLGLYSHSSLSYNGTKETDAMDSLASEINGCLDAANHHQKYLPKTRPLVISVGASPQVTAIKNFAGKKSTPKISQKLQAALDDARSWKNGDSHISLELHAGVYSVMDMQQLSTSSVTTLGGFETEIALSVVAEVISVYNNHERQQPEVLVAVGTLGLGREPCAAYKGWAVAQIPQQHLSDRRLIVQRISQEHSILAWESEDGQVANLPDIPLQVGQTVRLYPNHACVTGAMYDKYLVVDSDSERPNEVKNVWMRARGW